MSDIFTNQMRQVIQLANKEAREVNCDEVGTEYMLLGIIREGRNISAQILKDDFDITLENGREAVQEVSPRLREGVSMVWLPQSYHAKELITIATEISQESGLNYVSTEHLSLALMSKKSVIKNTKALQVLVVLNVSLDKWQEKMLAKLAEENTPRTPIYLGDN